MKFLTIISLAVLWSSNVFAQEPCGSMEHRRMLIAQDPKNDLLFQQVEKQTEQFVANWNGPPANRAMITIPVVVHVVYNTSAQNISDAQIQSQIDRLNLDFHKLNTDWNNTPTVWKSLVADYNIQFCLAARTPTGGATNGIIRKQTTSTSFTTDDKVKRSSSGGDDAWPSSSYLNIWVCNISGNVLGYAQFPGGPSATDGIVIKYTAFGSTGTATAPYNVGRTCTHEVGHWLNLYHVWGDDGGSCSGSDLVGDTPNQADMSFGCPSFPATDACATTSSGIMTMNYMNYSNDACMYMFTNGQYARSSSLFATNGFRVGLLSSQGCVAPNTAPVANFTANPTNACPGQSVQFTNTSTGNVTSYSWTFTGGNPASSTAQNPTVTYASAGTYNVSLTVSGPNGSNTKTSNAFITVSSASSLPMVQGFESTTFPPTGWTRLNADNSYTWGRTTSAGGFGASTASAYMDMYNYSTKGQTDWLITPAYDFTGVTNARVRWDYAYANVTTAGYYDTLMVYYSTNCGVTWTQIWKKGGTQLNTAPATAYAFIPTSSQWRRDSVTLTNLSGQQNVKFAFVTNNQYGNYLFLDNINLYSSAPAPPTTPTADFVGTPTTVTQGSTVAFTDLSANSPTSWSWSFTGGAPNSSTAQNPTIAYNTVGTYAVSLTATNSIGSNTVTKNAYITVIPHGTQTCDTLTNFVSTDTFALFSFQSPYWGYVAGHNAFGDLGKAEMYANSASKYVTGAFLRFGKATTKNPSSSVITVRVWNANGTNNGPGTVLASKTVLISSISADVTANRYTFVSFNSPQNITGNFFVGFTMTYVSGDTVGLVTSTITSPAPNNGWEQLASGNWYPYTDPIGSWGYNMDNAVFPILCNSTATAPSAAFTSSSNSICAGKSIQFTSTSSSSPTSYSWTFSGGSPANSTAANPLVTFNTAGIKTISLTVSNANGNNTVTSTITVNQVPALATSATPVACYGESTGSASVSANGGSQFTYAWSGGGATAIINNKPAGAYTVTVTNSNQCSATAVANIVQPLTMLAISASEIDATCGLSNGSATVIASGGTGGYQYLWNGGGTSATIENLLPGVYTVTVKDVNECSAITSTTVGSSNSSTVVNLNVVNDSCGLNEGFIAVVGNGTTSDTYKWNTGAATGFISGLSAGNYSVTITHANGCSDVAQTYLADNSALDITLNAQDPTGGMANGSITANVVGGTPPYIYSWSNGGTSTGISNLPDGNYTLTITDQTGCKKTAYVPLGNPSSVSTVKAFGSIKVYPNPVREELQVQIDLNQMSNIEYSIISTIGQKFYSRNINDYRNGTEVIKVESFPSGVYIFQVEGKNGRYSYRFVKE